MFIAYNFSLTFEKIYNYNLSSNQNWLVEVLTTIKHKNIYCYRKIQQKIFKRKFAKSGHVAIN